MRAIAVETVVKIGALLVVAGFAVLLLLRGSAPHLALAPPLERAPRLDLGYLTKIVLAAAAVFCLPRQFHVAFVELERPEDMKPTRWMFPIYLTLTCLAVIPLVSAGLRLQGPLLANPDLFVLAILFSAGLDGLTALVYIGGFSAATAMVVVETVALSAMASNQFILPWLTRRWEGGRGPGGIPATIIGVRQAAIAGVLFVACLYARALNTQENLVSIGLRRQGEILNRISAWFR